MPSNVNLSEVSKIVLANLGLPAMVENQTCEFNDKSMCNYTDHAINDTGDQG